MPTKALWQSKTIWANALAIVALVLSLVLQSAGVLALDPKLVVWGGIALAAVNAALRWFSTNAAIDGSPAAAPRIGPIQYVSTPPEPPLV